MRRIVWSAAFVALSSCGESPVAPADAGEELGIASSAQIVAWEGQPRFVTVLSAATGELLDGATVTAEDPAGALEVIEQRCAGTRCAAVLRIRDLVPNTGAAIPPPIDGRDAYLRVTLPDGPGLRALLRVMPLDTISGGGTEPLRVGGARLASSASMAAGVTFAGQPGGEPIRWVIFGGARLAGTLDVSAAGPEPAAGGYAGGAAGAAASGARGGGAGEGGAGGGGGGGVEPGSAGAGPADEPDGGGAGGAAGTPECALDFAVAACGGGGGGGAEGPGGAGGGALAIVSLSELDLEGATLRSAGAGGSMGAGGGAGGLVALAAPRWRAPAVLEVPGGAGEGRGGAGGAGGVHLQIPGASTAAELGPAVDLAGVPAITGDAAIELTGVAAPGALVRVRVQGGASAEATADGAGAFAVTIELAPGLNRMSITQELDGRVVRGWVGTSIELATETPGVALPSGASIDVARLP